MRALTAFGACCALLISCPAQASLPAQDAPEAAADADPEAAAADAADAPFLALLAQAQAAITRGAFAEALERIGEAEALAPGPDDQQAIVARFVRAQLLMTLGRHAEAEPQLLGVIDSLGRMTEPVPPLVRFLVTANLGTLYQRQERLVEAEEVFTRGLEEGEMLAQAQPPDPAAAGIVMTARNNLAFLYTSQGRLAEAEQLFLRVREESEARLAPDDPGRATFAVNLANLYQAQRRFDEAERLYAEALTAVAPDNPVTLMAASALGLMFVEQRRFAEGEPLLVRSLAAYRLLPGPNTLEALTALNNLAYLYMAAGRFAEAEPRFVEALGLADRLAGADSLMTANVAANLAKLRLSTPAAAAAAIAPARQFVGILRSRFADDPARMIGSAQRGRQEAARAIGFALLADAAWAAAAAGPDGRRALTTEVFAALQDGTAGRAGRAVVQMAVRRLADASGATLGALVRERESLADQWAVNSAEFSAAFANSGPETESLKRSLREDRARFEARMTEIDAILRRDFPQYFALIRPEALDVAAAQAMLAPDEAILLVVPTEFGVHVVAVSRDSASWARSAWTRERIDAAVLPILRAAGAAVGGPRASARGFPRAAAYDLYRQVVAPADPVLAGKRHLFIVAAGSLSSLPFGLLVAEPPRGDDSDPRALRATRWFAEVHALIQIPTIQSLQFLRRSGAPAAAPAAATAFIGFGNPALRGAAVQRGPDFAGPGVEPAALFRPGRTRDGGAVLNLSQLGRMSRLPGTAIELEYIRASLDAPHSALFLADRATERNVRNTDLSGVRILAFATHGLLAGMVRETGEPGLVFTPPAQASEADDGYLTASEVSALRLDADWVILSACNTASGDGSQGAPGLSGLARAFFYAGARNLLASHWPVRDDVAAQITVRTIQIQRADPALSRAEAFQRAMREIRDNPAQDSAGATWAHPNAWAPFTLIGDGAR